MPEATDVPQLQVHGPADAPMRYVTHDGETWCSGCDAQIWNVDGHDAWHNAGRPVAARQRLGRFVDDGD